MCDRSLQEADFFYLPVYTSCFIFPVLGAADFPYFHRQGGVAGQSPRLGVVHGT